MGNGQILEANNRNGNRTHPFMLKIKGKRKVNLWLWRGDPMVADDYARRIKYFTVEPPMDVSAPGMLGLFGLALIVLGFGRRRRSKISAA